MQYRFHVTDTNAVYPIYSVACYAATADEARRIALQAMMGCPLEQVDEKVVADTLAALTVQQPTKDGAGAIDKDWLANARANEYGCETVEVWFARALNCKTVGIEDNGQVWIQGGPAGHWLSQEVIDRTCAEIDAWA